MECNQCRNYDTELMAEKLRKLMLSANNETANRMKKSMEEEKVIEKADPHELYCYIYLTNRILGPHCREIGNVFNVKFCNGCGSFHSKLKKCNGCKQVYYCGRICQKWDWSRRHSRQCKKEIK